MNLYSKSLNRMKSLIQTYDWINFQIINRKNGPRGGVYDFQTKKLLVNKYNYQPFQVILLIIHQFHHAMQDRDGYFDNKKVRQRIQFQYDLINKNIKYNQKKHKKYLNEILKLQYDCQKRCYNFIKEDDILSDYINVQDYLRDMNFYALQIKYFFIKRDYFLYNDEFEMPNIKNKLLSNKQLLRPLTKTQLMLFNENKK